jgi:hypothetical protein
VAHEFGLACWRPERRKVTGVGDTVAFTVASLPATTQLSKMAQCDMVNGLRHGATAVNGASSGDGRLAFKLIRSEDLFTPRRYPGTSEHESHRRRQSRRKVTGGDIPRTC